MMLRLVWGGGVSEGCGLEKARSALRLQRQHTLLDEEVTTGGKSNGFIQPWYRNSSSLDTNNSAHNNANLMLPP
jgi:hypothetical protein